MSKEISRTHFIDFKIQVFLWKFDNLKKGISSDSTTVRRTNLGPSMPGGSVWIWHWQRPALPGVCPFGPGLLFSRCVHPPKILMARCIADFKMSSTCQPTARNPGIAGGTEKQIYQNSTRVILWRRTQKYFALVQSPTLHTLRDVSFLVRRNDPNVCFLRYAKLQVAKTFRLRARISQYKANWHRL